MGGVNGGDDDRLDLGVGDHALAIVAKGADAVLRSQIVRALGRVGADSDDRRAGNRFDDAAAVVLADGAAADQTDLQNLIQCKYPP